MTPEEKEASAWLEALYDPSLESRKRTKLIFSGIDAWLSAGKFGCVEAVMRLTELHRLALSEVIALLATTRWGHGGFAVHPFGPVLPSKCQGYSAFYARVTEYLISEGIEPERRKGLLQGLEP
jgi:hypothetical protein